MSPLRRLLTRPSLGQPELTMTTTPNLFLPAAWLAIGVAAVLLAACGGGGDGGSEPTVAPSSQVQPGSPSTCPMSKLEDIWITNRLGCLTVGQRVVSASAGATGATADRLVPLGQRVLDTRFNNVLGTDVLRHYKFFICMKNAPDGISPTAVAVDLAGALGIGSALLITYLPPGVSGSTLESGSGAESTVVSMTCDAAQHPVIADYATGQVLSINPWAIANVQIYDR